MDENLGNVSSDHESEEMKFKKFERPVYVEEEFNIRKEDIEVPDDIMRKIESGDYKGYNKEMSEYYKSRLIFVGLFLIVTVVAVILASSGKRGFEFGKLLGFLTFFYLGSGFILLMNTPLPKKPRYSELPVSERKLKYMEEYINQEYHRLKGDFANNQRRLQDERFQGLKNNIECLFDEIAMTFYFIDKVHLLNYRTWLSLDIHKVHDYLQSVFQHSSLTVNDQRPFFIMESSETGKVCGLYFSYATTPAGSSIVEKIRRMKMIHLVDEVYFISVENCPEKLLKQLHDSGIKWMNLRDLVNSLFFILKFDKIINQIAAISVPMERVSLVKLYDVVSVRTRDYMTHLFDLATWDYEEELALKSKKTTDHFLSYLERKFGQNPFEEKDQIDLRENKLKFLSEFPIKLDSPFYNYREFEVMNSSKPYGPRNWSPYPRYGKDSYIIR